MNFISSRSLIRLSILPLTCLVVSALSTSWATAQVNGSGISDSALFNNIINVPADGPFLSGSAGGVAGETTQINVTDGGLLDFGFAANSGTEVNVSGGDTDAGFTANDSEVNVSGTGNVGCNFTANDSEINVEGGIVGGGFIGTNSVVNFSGGMFGPEAQAINSIFNISGGSFFNPFFFDTAFLIAENSEVNILGDDFLIDGAPLAFNGSSVITDRNVTLSGVLGDGSSFSFTIGTTNDGTADLVLDAGSTLTVVPEPSSFVLITALAGMGLARRRRS